MSALGNIISTIKATAKVSGSSGRLPKTITDALDQTLIGRATNYFLSGTPGFTRQYKSLDKLMHKLGKQATLAVESGDKALFDQLIKEQSGLLGKQKKLLASYAEVSKDPLNPWRAADYAHIKRGINTIRNVVPKVLLMEGMLATTIATPFLASSTKEDMRRSIYNKETIAAQLRGRMNVNYEQMNALEEIQMGNMSSDISVGGWSNPSLNSMLVNSTHGLVQGLHSRRHG